MIRIAYSLRISSFRPKPTLHILEQFVRSADEANIHLTSIDKIKTVIGDCHQWNSRFEQMQQGEHYPFLSSYEQLYDQACTFHIDLEPLKFIEQTITQARTWLEKAQGIFRRSESSLSLIEMIAPRVSVAPKMLTKKRQSSKRMNVNDGPTNESIGVLDETIGKVLASEENDPENVVRRSMGLKIEFE